MNYDDPDPRNPDLQAKTPGPERLKLRGGVRLKEVRLDDVDRTITLANLTGVEYDHFANAVRKAMGAKEQTRFEKALAGVGKFAWTMVTVAACVYLITFLLHHAINLSTNF